MTGKRYRRQFTELFRFGKRTRCGINCVLYGREGKERARGLGTYDVRLNGWFAPFAVLKGLKDVVPEVEEGVEV